jgi:hypothetical protein
MMPETVAPSNVGCGVSSNRQARPWLVRVMVPSTSFKAAFSVASHVPDSANQIIGTLGKSAYIGSPRCLSPFSQAL